MENWEGRGTKECRTGSTQKLKYHSLQKEARLKYKYLANCADRCHLINGNNTIEKTHQLIWKIVSNCLELSKL